MTLRTNMITSLMVLSMILGGLVGCAPLATQPSILPTATSAPALPSDAPEATSAATSAPASPSGWESYASPQPCGYAIDHPSDMQGASQGTYSWSLLYPSTEPSGPVPNFVYISVIPDDLQSTEPGAVYNYDPAETQTLLGMQVSESRSLRAGTDIAPAFTYTRLPDVALGGQSAQAYENTQPWEFPAGTKEIRYYLKANGCTYLVGGYMAAEGLSQPGAIDEALFDQIISTFRLTS